MSLHSVKITPNGWRYWEIEMNILQPDEIGGFIERFYSCYDGVIRSIDVRFRTADKPTQITVGISARDSQAVEDEGWINLQLEMLDVAEFTFREPPNRTNQVIYGGLHIVYREGLFFVDLGFLDDESSDINEYRASDVYVATRSLGWDVLPYDESPA